MLGLLTQIKPPLQIVDRDLVGQRGYSVQGIGGSSLCGIAWQVSLLGTILALRPQLCVVARRGRRAGERYTKQPTPRVAFRAKLVGASWTAHSFQVHEFTAGLRRPSLSLGASSSGFWLTILEVGVA